MHAGSSHEEEGISNNINLLFLRMTFQEEVGEEKKLICCRENESFSHQIEN
jgi:hypothetical protein